ncbi:MAG TPA: threonylcarbamoyl-AMP synthase [Firmicutes bacterium]|nr:threonylcarbamoyl-AMP synthase [Bacillota bacterium]
MLTKIIRAADEKGIEAAAKLSAKVIRRGGLVALPTETVYGLGANALDKEAVNKIFAAKGRPQDNPLIVHVSGIEMAKNLLADIPPLAYKLSEKFWPGPLTMIMQKRDVIPDTVSAGLDTIGVRMPKSAAFLRTIEESGVPIAAPSANTSGKPSPTTAQHVYDDLNGKIDLIVDGGSCSVGIESTVVDITGDIPVILRPGAITPSDIASVAGAAEVSQNVLKEAEEGKAPPSPGMKYKHYSPSADVILVQGSDDGFKRFISSIDNNTAVVCFSEDAGRIKHDCFVLGDKHNHAMQAARLFDILREIDKCGYKNAYIRLPDMDGIGLALYNRLIRAASFRVIDCDKVIN